MKRVPASSSPSFNFLHKLDICQNPPEHKKPSEIQASQMSLLKDVTSMLQSTKQTDSLIIPNLAVICSIIKSKIFRPLPSGLTQNQLEVEDIGFQYEAQEDQNWPVLKEYYQVFFLIASNQQIEIRQLKRLITNRFLTHFFYLFDSQNADERILLRNILHRLYAKLVPRRKMIRRFFRIAYQEAIYEKPYFNGMSQILDINASIIAGFALPLRAEHIEFFETIMVPMLKVQTIVSFFQECMRCIMLFLMKFRDLAIPLLKGMLRYWPHANSLKEVSFLTLLSEVLPLTDFQENKELLKKIVTKIGGCMEGEHVQIADRALCTLQNSEITQMIQDQPQLWLPILVPALRRVEKTCWHTVIKESAQSALKILKELSPAEFKKIKEQNEEESKKEALILQSRSQKWEAIEAKLKQDLPSFEPSAIPYSKDTVLQEFNHVYASVASKLTN